MPQGDSVCILKIVTEEKFVSSASVLFYHRIVVEILNQSSVLSLLDYYKTHWDANSVIIFKPNGLNFIILSLTVLMNLFTVPETKQYSRLTLYSSRRSKG